MIPNIFPFSSIPLYGLTQAFAYAKLQGHHTITRLLILYIPGFLFLTLVQYIVFWTIIHPYLFCTLRHLPKVKEYTWFTTKKQPINQAPGENVLGWIKSTPNDGLILLRSAFQVNQIIVTAPNALVDILVHHPYDFEKAQGVRDVLRNVLGDGLVLTEGDLHRFQRRHLIAPFNFRNIKNLYPVMWEKSWRMIDHIKAELKQIREAKHEKFTVGKPQKGRLEFNNWASRATLDIIGIAALGKDFNCLHNTDFQLVRDYEELLAPDGWRLALFIISAFFGWKVAKQFPWKTKYDFYRLARSLRSTGAQLIRDKREAMNKGGEHHDILALLISSNNFNDTELLDHVLTFLAAGHETTSSEMTWIMFVLSTRPELQEQLRTEIREAIPGDLRSCPTNTLADTLEKLPLLNAICQETLRLYPTIPFTSRLANKDTSVLGHYIPKGSPFLMSAWAINRSPDLWGPSSEEFKPERWITNGKPNNHGGTFSSYCVLTFLHGPRNCIGQGFAKAELRCLLASVVTTFKWSLAMPIEDVIPMGVISVKPKNGLYLQMTEIA